MNMADNEKLEFANRLNKVLDKKGYPIRGRAQKVLADTGLSISDRAINKWLKGESIPDHSNLALLSRFYDVGFNWLATGTGQITTQSQFQNKQSQQQTLDELRQQIADIQNPSYEGLTFKDAELVSMADSSDKVPVISWVAAGSWSNVETVSIEDIALAWIARPARLSKRGFALIVKGRSMLPEFKPDDIIFVEPETGFLMLKDGDLVVVSCNDDTEATFKQLVIGETSDDMYLKPLNPEWKEQKMLPVGDCNLVGKVVGKYVEY